MLAGLEVLIGGKIEDPLELPPAVTPRLACCSCRGEPLELQCTHQLSIYEILEQKDLLDVYGRPWVIQYSIFLVDVISGDLSIE